ncbi:MAG: aminotransferase class I/II-fold pyridoxal phosphate-dependent enzyme [Pseudomonadota bacterium]
MTKITLSRRLAGLNAGGTDGWEVHARATQMARAGRQVTFLTVGEHDSPPPDRILDAMDHAARQGHTRYTPMLGQPELRAAVATHVADKTGVPTGPENVLIVPGAQAGLFTAHLALADPGDTGLIVDPYYATYPGTLRAAGLIPRIVETTAASDFMPTRANLEARAAGARTLLINTPNNPTGAVYDAKTLDGIAEVVCDHDLALISDEVYAAQVWDGAHLSPRAIPGLAERTLVVGSLSKSHAMTGFRAGWVVGPEPVITAMADIMINMTYGIAGFVQQAALHALAQGAAMETAIAAPFQRRRALALEILSRQQVIRVVQPRGAMYVMLDIRATGLTGVAFAEALLEAEAIAVMPGESFGRAAAGHVRVALSVDDATFADALTRLIAFAETCALP